jgi:hypothetical protein
MSLLYAELPMLLLLLLLLLLPLPPPPPPPPPTQTIRFDRSLSWQLDASLLSPENNRLFNGSIVAISY